MCNVTWKTYTDMHCVPHGRQTLVFAALPAISYPPFIGSTFKAGDTWSWVMQYEVLIYHVLVEHGPRLE